MLYLVGTLLYCVDELLDHHVYTLETRPFKLHNLLLHYSFKGHIGCEQACPEPARAEKKHLNIFCYKKIEGEVEKNIQKGSMHENILANS